MPRTKKRVVKRPSSDMNMTCNMTMANQPKSSKEILAEFDSEKKKVEEHFSELNENFRNTVENAFLMIKMNLSGSLNKKLYDYISECNPVKSSSATTSTAKGVDRPTRPVNKTNQREKRHNSASTSKTNSSAPVIKQNRSADDRAPLSEKINESKYRTPMNRPPPNNLANTVTPKVNMNEPISVMRRPNQGEVALSMTGSPLMVSSVSRDDMATVSVPLANGNILSILPRNGATMDISFDDQTKKELLLLKGNIEDLLKMKKSL